MEFSFYAGIFKVITDWELKVLKMRTHKYFKEQNKTKTFTAMLEESHV